MCRSYAPERYRSNFQLAMFLKKPSKFANLIIAYASKENILNVNFAKLVKGTIYIFFFFLGGLECVGNPLLMSPVMYS